MKQQNPTLIVDMPFSCYNSDDICDEVNDSGNETDDEENYTILQFPLDSWLDSCSIPAVNKHYDLKSFNSLTAITYKIKSGRKIKTSCLTMAWTRWLVSLSVDEFKHKGYLCGRILISQEWILTAALIVSYWTNQVDCSFRKLLQNCQE